MKTHLFKILAVIGCLLSNVILYAHQFESDGIYYSFINYTTKTVEVTYRGSSYDSYIEYKGSVVIPDSVTYQGEIYNVTSIGYGAFKECTGLTSITIPNSVTSIGNSAFSGCTGLTSITIPNSVTSIGNGAFYRCTGLTEVTIPNSVASIGDEAFYYCTGLTGVTIPNSVTTIGESAFKACHGLTSITIPESVTSVGGSAFYKCTGLTTVNFNAEHCRRMGYDKSPVFQECNNLKTLNIGESVKAIPNYAFSACSGLTEVTIPNSVTSIGNGAFYNCSGLTEITIPNSVTSIGDEAFEGRNSLTTIYCHATTPPTIYSDTFSSYTATLYVPVKSMDAYKSAEYWANFTYINKYLVDGLSYTIISSTDVEVTYKDNKNTLNNSYSGTINIPETIEINGVTYNVTSLGYRAFAFCSDLTEVSIPNSVTSIGSEAFRDCTGLTSVTIGNSVTSIGDYAFYNCTGLVEITIPNSVTSIGKYAFIGCTGMTSVTIPNSVTSIGSDAFYGCNIAKTIWLTNTPPNGYKNVSSKVHYVANEQYTGLSNVRIYPYISSLFETGGVKYVPVSPSERTCDAIDCCYDSTATIMQIDSVVLYKGVVMTVKEVMPYTLYNQDYIKTLSINNSGNVGEEAFYSCKNLTTATLGDSIKSIGSNAFSNCTSLSEIVIPNGVISIGESAFYGCTGLTKAIIGNSVTSISSSAFGGCASLDSIYIGRKVATVGENAFSDCKKLADITIPASVTTIGDYVFSGCTSLSDVVIEDRTTALSLGSNGSSGLFANCPLDSVYIGGKITYKTSSSYGYSPFYRNTSLRTVVITDTETEIYDNEFYGCSNLTKVTIGDGVKKIGNWAFSGCSSLDHFAFGTNVESIGQEAFSDCTNVTNIRSYSAVPPVCGTQALDDINKWNCTLSVLENCQSAYQTAEQWKDFFFVNAMDKDGKVATPVITVDSVVVTISCETAKTTIYYTTDGSEPTVESALYTGPFVVDKNCTIKAIAVRTNYYNSDISTAQVDYFVYAESIAIDYETVSIRLNESVTLTATVLPETTANRVVVWSSSDENIATVENGIVTAHTIGEATITATTTDGTNLSATCKVTVLPILADTITLDQTNITAMEGETVVLTATIYPEDATEKGVVWSVSDATIATIEPLDNVSAKITVLKEGVATITATTIDGSNLSATCTIDVYSGIKNVQLDDTPTEYYDLSGRRVEHPTQGVYITKQGSTVRKVVVNER